MMAFWFEHPCALSVLCLRTVQGVTQGDVGTDPVGYMEATTSDKINKKKRHFLSNMNTKPSLQLFVIKTQCVSLIQITTLISSCVCW